MASSGLLVWLSTTLVLADCVTAVYSSRLIHRFSDELKLSSGATEDDSWPVRGSLEYYQRLLVRDFQRQKMKLGRRHQLVFPSEGSQALSFGNDLGWLHYTWIDIGTPNTSFLVALDDGSDLLWVPCKCIQCAPLSTGDYGSLGRDLNEYDPARSSTSRNLTCGHELCGSGVNCKSSTQPCPYSINYLSVNTSSSGMLFEDVLHLSSSSHSASNESLQASIILGCGRMQSGGYLEGVAPDGLMGLGLGQISVPSFLAKSGLVRDSFSLCFRHDGSGTIYFGDQGLTTQKMTPFVPVHGIKMYAVGVDACCIGRTCLEQTSFSVLIDSGTSFSALPADVYDIVVREFDSQVNATRQTYDGYEWEYCYKSSGQKQSEFPSVRFMFATNNSFVIHYPMFPVYENEEIVGYCLTVQKAVDLDIGIIGQDFMTGYRIVFDRENMKLGWSHSNCVDMDDEGTSGGSGNPLPTNEQESRPRGHAVAPAIAGKAPSISSAPPTLHATFWVIFLFSPCSIFMLYLHHGAIYSSDLVCLLIH